MKNKIVWESQARQMFNALSSDAYIAVSDCLTLLKQVQVLPDEFPLLTLRGYRAVKLSTGHVMIFVRRQKSGLWYRDWDILIKYIFSPERGSQSQDIEHCLVEYLACQQQSNEIRLMGEGYGLPWKEGLDNLQRVVAILEFISFVGLLAAWLNSRLFHIFLLRR